MRSWRQAMRVLRTVRAESPGAAPRTGAPEFAGTAYAGTAIRAAVCVAIVSLSLEADAQPIAGARRSGFEDMSAATRAMQSDDAQNPGMLWVAEGAVLWGQRAREGGRSCADCHGEAARTMRGVAARYPGFDEVALRPVDLGQRIDLCRQRHQQAAPFGPESAPRLSLEAFVAHHSRGLPIAPSDDPRLAPFRARGEQLHRRRIGQLDLSCAQCHDDNAGRRLGGSPIPQGHPTGYPVYRLEWRALGSLQRRLRGCMTGVRAEPFAFDAIELIEWQLHLARRAAGMPLESPAVRP